MRIVACLIIAAATGAAAFLPGEYLVSSPKLVETSAAEGVWYLSPSPAGHLYLADGRALARLAPYRIWDDDPETSAYYLVYEYAAGAAVRAASFGELSALGEDVYLLTAAPGRRADLVTAGLPVQLVKLTPMRRAARFDNGEEPAPEFDADVEAALASITQNQVRGYIQTLQDFETRFSYTEGYTDAAAWAYDFFEDLGYETSYDDFVGLTFNDVSAPTDGRTAWIASDGGTVYYTKNRGNTWERQDAPAKGFLWSIEFVNDSVGYAVGEGATCVKTADGGATWRAQAVSGEDYLFGVCFTGTNRGWIAAEGGKIFHTSSGGATWEEQTTPVTARLYDVSMADATHGWACGRDGVIIRTADGQTWTQQNSNTTTRLYGIYAVSADEAWCCGWAKTLLHTTDGGTTWTPVVLTEPVWAYFYDVRFGDSDHGYVVGLDGAFLSTDDGGATWDYKAVGQDDMLGCDFATASFGFVGGGAALYRTDDGGATFDSLMDNFDDQWRNVVAQKEGRTVPDEIVIICGHMDSISEIPLVSAPGAEDNGSGTAATLAAASALAGLDFERTLRFICWCGEEQGLLGSRHYAQASAENGENIVGVVNLDMVAYDEENGARDDTSDFANDASKWLAEYLIDVGDLYDIDHIFDLVVDPEAGASDHASFWAVGYDAIFLIEGESGVGGVIEYPYYHTTQDTIDKLDMKFQVDCSRVCAGTVAHLAHVMPNPGPIAAPAPDVGGEGFAVYPNPYKAGAGPGRVRFDGLKGVCTLEVYDLSGHRIFSYYHTARAPYYDWSVVSDNGEDAASGVYVYRVTGDDMDESGRLAIIR